MKIILVLTVSTSFGKHIMLIWDKTSNHITKLPINQWCVLETLYLSQYYSSTKLWKSLICTEFIILRPAKNPKNEIRDYYHACHE